MRRVLPFVVAGLLSMVAADPLLAQQRLFAFTPEEVVEVDTRLATLGQPIHRVRLEGNANRNADPGIPAAGGSLLAWAVNGRVVLYDTRTRAVQAHAVPGFVAGSVLGTDRGSFALSVLGSSPGSVNTAILTADLRSGAVRILDLGLNLGPLGFPATVAYAGDTGLLFLAKQLPASDNGVSRFLDVRVLRLSDGELLKQFAVEQSGATLVGVNPTGTRLFVADVYTGLHVVDVVAGVPVASNPALVYDSGRTWVLDEHRGRLLSATSSFPGGRIDAFAVDTLQPIGGVGLPAFAPLGGSVISIDVSEQSATIFAATVYSVRTTYTREVCPQAQLLALNVDTGALRASGDLTPIVVKDHCVIRLTRITEPGAPAAPTAAVTGARVTFDWPAVAALTYELEAGTAQGLANIGRFTATENHFSVDGVPPGVYYVRVRGVNVVGKGASSQDVRVVVQ